MNKTVTQMLITFTILLFSTIFGCDSEAVYYTPKDTDDETLNFTKRIPAGGNSWVFNDISQTENIIFDSGIHNWTSTDDVIRTYFWTNKSGSLHVGLNIKAPTGSSTIKVTVGDETKEVEVSNTDYADVEIGAFNLDSDGYHFVEIQGIEKSSTYIGDVTEILIGGSATSGDVHYIENEEDFYFGRRGPSVHLSYSMPENKDILWFYNEVTISENEDVLGSYFMANGFNEGYFGMQVNSETERRILFSVWSPYTTDNPDEIPEDYRIKLLGSGDGVTINSFGNEGSGGQSYLKYDWVAGTTYKFLLKGEPAENNSTDYTAYFYAPELGEWKLIASFRRPYTNTYLTRFHSFLENFITHTGDISRKGNYQNQWVYDTDGNWNELTEAKFTVDATGRNEVRLDFTGGAEGESFYLKNCGFISESTTPDISFSRTASGNQPEIEFTVLEVPTVK
ncbi:MAG: nematoblast specific protein [Thalassobius sp.]|nr:nematoblast specific protein [Thalassovita sp.]